jgi:hypothetical protein
VSGLREPDLHQRLGPGGFVRLAYRLGLEAASGVLTLRVAAGVRPAERPEVFVLRRGAVVSGEGDLARRALLTRLARAAAEPGLVAAFEAGVAACPPGGLPSVPLAGWARSQLERQLDASLADALLRELAGARLAVRPELAPSPLDDADRRMLAALAVPRRLDQIWSLARAPRFRLLALLHVLRRVGALSVDGAADSPRDAAPPRPSPAAPRRSTTAPRHSDPRAIPVVVHRADARRAAAMQLLGIDDTADLGAVKRAYRRLARSVHPDLQPGASAERRHHLERRFAELTAAYEALI